MVTKKGYYLRLAGSIPYIPIAVNEEEANPSAASKRVPSANTNTDSMRRARVLCSYDANDHTELTLTANEVGNWAIISTVLEKQ